MCRLSTEIVQGRLLKVRSAHLALYSTWPEEVADCALSFRLYKEARRFTQILFLHSSLGLQRLPSISVPSLQDISSALGARGVPLCSTRV